MASAIQELSWLAVLTAIAWGLVVVWGVSVLVTTYALARLRPLPPVADARLAGGPDAPLVSVLVPARDEAGRVLEESIRSMLAQDYAPLEVVAVNDRSTDATGSILDALARADARLLVVEGRELPAGWLGKPHALQQALERARGEWVLLTDADMVFDPRAVRTAVAHALAHGYDALTLIPHFESRSFWERVVIPAWTWVLFIVTLLYRANSPRSRRGMGIGGFFLVRRPALERAGGFEALRTEVAEDFRLAGMLKAAGARFRIESAPRLARTRMYRNFRELWECHAKNWFAGAGYSLPLAWASTLWTYFTAVAPAAVAIACAAALALGAGRGLWGLFVPTFLVWAAQVLILVLVGHRLRVAPVYALCAPLGLALLYAILVDSGVRITTGRGVSWKGRKVYERAGGMRPPRGGGAARRNSSA